jgi:hypothetical protein
VAGNKKSNSELACELSVDEMSIVTKVIDRYIKAHANRSFHEGFRATMYRDFKKRYLTVYLFEKYGRNLEFTVCIIHDKKSKNIYIGVTKRNPSDEHSPQRASNIALTRAVRSILDFSTEVHC